jgi:hypothetical protein
VENAALRSVITAVFDLGPNARQLLRLLLAEIDDPAAADQSIVPERPVPARLLPRRRWSAKRVKNAPRRARPPPRRPRRRLAVGPRCAGNCAFILTPAACPMPRLPARSKCRTNTLRTWLAKNSPAPSGDAQARIRRWLNEGTVLPETAPPFQLTETEQNRLRGHISLVDERQLRSQSDSTRPPWRRPPAARISTPRSSRECAPRCSPRATVPTADPERTEAKSRREVAAAVLPDRQTGSPTHVGRDPRRLSLACPDILWPWIFASKALVLLASPTGFEPVLPP